MNPPRQPQSLDDYLKLSTAEKMELFKADQAKKKIKEQEQED